MELSPHLLVAAQALLDRHDISSPREITPLLNGGLSRLYRVRSSEGRLLLKQSTRDGGASPNRLASEFRFCQFLHRAGLWQAPEPLALDEGEGLALYEHIDGRPLRRAEIGEPEIEAAMDFVHEINIHRHRSDARELAIADQAVFSISDHIQVVDRRVQLLSEVETTNPHQLAARRFARDELLAAWKRIAEEVESECLGIGIDPKTPLTPERRILSPAEFGFHNALRDREGRIRFLDMEAAGWDDPARLIGDFSDHPTLPVSPTALEAFRVRVFSELDNGQFELRRSEILSPLFGARRCCHVLEDFLRDRGADQSDQVPRSDILASINPLAAARLILNRTIPRRPVHPALGQS